MHIDEKSVYIVSAVRTPIGKFGGVFANIPAPELAAHAIRAAVERAGLTPKDIQAYVMGHVIQAGVGQHSARRAALLAGIPEHVNGFVVNMVCSSGMTAIWEAAKMIMMGEYEIVLAGGMESMSRAPLAIPPEARWGLKHLITREAKLIDLMAHDGLTDSWNWKLMGVEADEVAWENNAPREELDMIAYESHMRAAKATDEGWFKEEIVPVEVTLPKKGRITVEADEGIRRDTSPEKLARLPPAFTPKGPHTAGNSSQLSDGAAALVLASGRIVRELGLKPLARIVGFAWVGLKPEKFVYGTVEAAKALLEKLGWRPEDVDYWEANEAFAINIWLFYRAFPQVPKERVNPHGGAIAIGHPLGCTGARLVVSLINELRVHGGRRGVATLCHGTGGATAMAIELV